MSEEIDRESAGGEQRSPLSRRAFLKSAGGIAAGGAVVTSLAAPVQARPAPSAAPAYARIAGKTPIELLVNGAKRTVEVEPRTTLLSALRCHMEPALTGTKEVCDRGACGACTVILGGKPVYACMLLAIDCQSQPITTIEGLGEPGKLSSVQEAFCAEDALMCGFCTPGFVVSISAALQRNPGASLDELKGACAGNLCRCGTYPHIFKAAARVVSAGSGRK